MPLTPTSVKRPVATAMFYLIIVTLGVIGFYYLPVDLLPPIEFPRLTVHVDYPNVGPQEIEQIITEPIENALAGVPDVDKMTSSSQEGRSYVSLSFAQGTNLDEAANDVRGALERVRDDLPDEAEAPGIWKFDPNSSPIVVLGVSSKTHNIEQLTNILDHEIRNQFEQIPGVGTINIWGGISRQINVNLKRDRLLATHLTSQDVINALASNNTTLPGGNVKQGISNLYVRSVGEYQSLDQIRNTAITSTPNGIVRVKDVANVVDGYADMNRFAEVDGQPMIRIAIQKQSGANTLKVAAAVKQEAATINKTRDDMHMIVATDESTFIQNSVNNVLESAVYGGLLAIFILYLFLRNGSTTFIIALAIPISIIATFALLYMYGMSLNLMSLGGLALGVGMMVDNAVVVIDNIVRLRHDGLSLKESSLTGTRQVGGAITSSTITTIVIFLPVVFMQSITGILFQQLALVIVFSLLCSLLVAFTLVPTLSSRFMTVKARHENRLGEDYKGHGFFGKVEVAYSHAVEKAIDHRYAVYIICIILVIASAWLSQKIPMELAPRTDADRISVDMHMADGTNIAVVNEFAKELDHYVRAIVPADQIKHYSRVVRTGRASIDITLVDASKRTITPSALADKIRAKIQGLIPGGEIDVQAEPGLWVLRRIFSSGDNDDAVQVELRGNDLKQAQVIAMDLEKRMQEIPGVTDVQISTQEGQPEQNITFDRQRIAQIGLSVSDVAQVLETNIGGTEASQYREGGDEYPIVVRLRPDDRLTSQDLSNIAIRSAAGKIMPISSVVKKNMSRSPTDINRIDGQRVTYISADLVRGMALGEAVHKMQAAFKNVSLPQGFSIVFGGEYQEQQKAASDFTLSIIMSLILVYMVMAAQFERFVDPLIVMFSVPVAIVGIVPTLLLTGTTLNMQSLMGIVMLGGIVVNNAIVLIDYINLLLREEKMEPHRAVVVAARLRLRPILMTTLATILGLLPMSFGWGAGGQIQASLARVVIGGLSASTLITLVLIPSVYVSIASLRERLGTMNWSPISRFRNRRGDKQA